MSYFIFNQSKNVDIFANTSPVKRMGVHPQVQGMAYDETKNFQPSTMTLFFTRDIQQEISDNKIPQMIFRVVVARQTPTPIYRVEIHHIVEPIVLRIADESEPEINCEPSTIGRVQLSELAHYVRSKIMQIFWRYNADLISSKGIYGHCHFNYQIAIMPELIERQIKSFNIARQRILRRENREDAIGKVA
ncbi:MAG: hypothetical protein AB7T49_06710 [Oligoflexales bacterium]